TRGVHENRRLHHLLATAAKLIVLELLSPHFGRAACAAAIQASRAQPAPGFACGFFAFCRPIAHRMAPADNGTRVR
ncbi:hypothetical protein, partial [Burkholderia pseudomultivorans]|uniref:hypothetical protein n=1 Tax=Burkholderia pseudomultivorans TaxID=1207504 RepID=UPI001C2EB148